MAELVRPKPARRQKRQKGKSQVEHDNENILKLENSYLNEITESSSPKSDDTFYTVDVASKAVSFRVTESIKSSIEETVRTDIGDILSDKGNICDGYPDELRGDELKDSEAITSNFFEDFATDDLTSNNECFEDGKEKSSISSDLDIEENDTSTSYSKLVEDLAKCIEETTVPSAPDISNKQSVSVFPSYLVSEHEKTELCDNLPTVAPCVRQTGVQMKDVLNHLELENELCLPIDPYSEQYLYKYEFNEEFTEQAKSYVENFRNTDHLSNVPLYSLIEEYLEYRKCFQKNKKKIPHMEKDLKTISEKAWTVWPDVVINERAKCSHNQTLLFTHQYQHARFNQDENEIFKISLADLKNTIFSVYLPVKLNMLVSFHSIVSLLRDLSSSCKAYIGHEHNSSISLRTDCDDLTLEKHVSNLCSAIGVIFHFYRKSTTGDDKEFNDYCKEWIVKLAAVLLRVATWKENLFLACHLMQCGPGVSEWAASIVQCPPSSSGFMLALANIFLRPCLNFDLTEPDCDDPWVLVDSEGEDQNSGLVLLHEDDLTAFFKQIPFRSSLENHLKIGEFTEFSLLRLIALASAIVDSFGAGIDNYSDNRFRQFGKRLGKIVRQVIEFVSDAVEIFAEVGEVSVRLQIEFDAFVLRAARCLHNAPYAWQFLAAAPFHMCSEASKWRLCLILQLYDGNNIDLTMFEKMFAAVPDAEQIYLLSTLCNIALSNGRTSPKLVRCISFQILYVGFLSPETRETNYKSAQSLLASLCSKHCYLMSEILAVQNNYFESGDCEDQSLSLGLWMELPVNEWLPTFEDMQLLSSWLLTTHSDSRNGLARCILKLVHYSNIPHDVQKQLAFSVLQAYTHHSEDLNFVNWTWPFLLQLRLHIVDFSSRLLDLSGLSEVYDLSSLTELNLLVSKNEPLACFIALCTTTVGHAVPLIYSQGFSLVNRIWNEKRYEAAFHCIEVMSVLFWDCHESLLSCAAFMAILAEIVVIDNTYLKMAKNLIADDSPGPILQKFCAMLSFTLKRGNETNLVKPVQLWFNCIVHLPLWQNCSGALHILDVICRHAIGNSAAWSCVLETLENALSRIVPVQSKSPLSSLINWMGSSSFTVQTMLSAGYSPSHPWFVFAAITVEFEVFEKRTTLWATLLQELSCSLDKKTSVDNSLKKACLALKLPIRSSPYIAFYRWAAQLLAMPANHPACILICQKLAELYVARVPGIIDRGSVGACFFSGTVNSNLKKRILARLEQIRTEQPCLNAEFQMFSFWLSEPVILNERLHVPSLPASYQPGILLIALHGDWAPWLQYIPLEILQSVASKEISLWLGVLSRSRKNTMKPAERPMDLPKESIKRRLTELGDPLPPPIIAKFSGIGRKFTFQNFVDTSFQRVMLPAMINTCIRYSNDYCKSLRSMTLLEYTLPELLTQFYSAKQYSREMVKGCSPQCLDRAKIRIQYNQWDANSIKTNEFHKQLELLQKNVKIWELELNDEIVSQSFFVLAAANALCTELTQARLYGNDFVSFFQDLGVSFFKTLVHTIATNFEDCPVVRDVFFKCVKLLGENCISGQAGEMEGLLYSLLEHGDVLQPIKYLFNPNSATNEDFVKMYGIALTATTDENVSILLKFDVEQWLTESNPKFFLRSQLLAHIVNRLFTIGAHDEKYQELSQLLNRNIQLLVLHKFPDHYGELLLRLMDGSRQRSVSCNTWSAFLIALSPTNLSLPPSKNRLNLKKIINFLNRFAVEQKTLCIPELEETADLLGRMLLADRINSGSQGLYAVYDTCSELIILFCGMILQSIVVQTVLAHPGALSVELSERLWPQFIKVFGPWILPFEVSGNVLMQPFAENEAAVAGFSTTIFTESIRYLTCNLAGGELVLSKVWHFYAEHFCKKDVSGLVLSTIHSNLATLPWYQFVPYLQDVEVMLSVIEQYLPLCHSFLANIFVSVTWKNVIRQSLSAYGSDINSRLHSCLLHLLLKIPSEPSLKQNKAVKQQIEAALEYAWHLLDSTNYSNITHWFYCSTDPFVVLDDPSSSYHELDKLTCLLLQVAAGYSASSKYFHPTTRLKRQLYVAATVKCLATAQSKRKRGLSSDLIKKFVTKHLNDVEIVINATVSDNERLEAASDIIYELLKMFSETALVPAVEEALLQWLQSGRSQLVIKAILHTAGSAIANPVIFGSVIEACIESSFSFGGESDWTELIETLSEFSGGPVQIDHVLISNSLFLTLYALVLKRQRCGAGNLIHRADISNLLQMFSTVKSSCENEPKLMLLAGLVLLLAEKEVDAAVLLQTLVDCMAGLAQDRSSGLLSTLGLKKLPSPSIKFKVCCLVAAAGTSKILEIKCRHISNDKSMATLEKAENNKQLVPVLAYLLTARASLRSLDTATELVTLIYRLSTQLFDKMYFVPWGLDRPS